MLGKIFCTIGAAVSGGKRGARMPNAECRMPNAECRMPSAEGRGPNAECRMPSAECRMPNVPNAGRGMRNERRGAGCEAAARSIFNPGSLRSLSVDDYGRRSGSTSMRPRHPTRVTYRSPFPAPRRPRGEASPRHGRGGRVPRLSAVAPAKADSAFATRQLCGVVPKVSRKTRWR